MTRRKLYELLCPEYGDGAHSAEECPLMRAIDAFLNDAENGAQRRRDLKDRKLLGVRPEPEIDAADRMVPRAAPAHGRP